MSAGGTSSWLPNNSMTNGNSQSESSNTPAIHPAARSNANSGNRNVSGGQSSSGSSKYIDLTVEKLSSSPQGILALQDLNFMYHGVTGSSQLYGFVPGALFGWGVSYLYPRWMGWRPTGTFGALAMCSLSGFCCMASLFPRLANNKMNTPVMIQANHTIAHTMHNIRLSHDPSYTFSGEPSMGLLQSSELLGRGLASRPLLLAELNTRFREITKKCDRQRLLGALLAAGLGVGTVWRDLQGPQKQALQNSKVFMYSCFRRGLYGLVFGYSLFGVLCTSRAANQYLAKRSSGWVPDYQGQSARVTVDDGGLMTDNQWTDTIIGKQNNEFDTTRSSNQDSAALEMSSGNYDQSQTSTTFI